ncbi:sirohydrochlorin cobaltochelatase [Psychromonas marina]|uniref:Sirohydrochlorin cobaltochelatase n=1 Tax=Psychromonas marina TaxID=88364 RepID=A0ABQ6E0I3_9GAMM|nr:CbiX/SirB N-terminal domain-containing protein [Psychromonas marina]GLS90852.1 sirohydrochlorin cobaltochelatase [Psychromonas marina]
MKALLLIAHGSRRKKSNDEVVVLAQKLKATCADQYQVFEAGFLEIANPAIATAVETCIKQGATSITVLPYFLNSGLHVTTDIPEHVEEAQQQFPEIDIKVAPHIGASELMMSLLIDAANSVN